MRTDATTPVLQLREQMAQFVAEREWEQFHSPKNLVMGLSVEVAELMEHFLWVDNAEASKLLEEAPKRQEVADELADVFGFVLALSNALQLDLTTTFINKLAKTAVKYPVELSRGRYQVPEQEK